MKLLRIHVVSTNTCGGLLDGLDLHLREPIDDPSKFEPICLVGPNGSGKSQFLQLIAEIMQSIWHAISPNEERLDGNSDTQFEIEYLIRPVGDMNFSHIRASRMKIGRKKPVVILEIRKDAEWNECKLDNEHTKKLLPQRICGYSSGDNETLSLPFLVSRSGYADEVRTRALEESTRDQEVLDTRLMLIDYGTNLEVLAANLLVGKKEQRKAVLQGCDVDDIHSLRCIIQLAHPSHPKAPRNTTTNRKGIQLTTELESYIDQLQACSTCFKHDEKTDTYTFDFWINRATREAFGHYWKSIIAVYSAFHKLAMLNDLAIPKGSRTRFKKATRARTFASQLPEPQEEEKVFRFEQIKFHAKTKGNVDYVSLSDGEHQLGQLLGTMLMQSKPGTLFLLDEPESHFNPNWRVQLISRMLGLPTDNGTRLDSNNLSSAQECILTTHAPFVPCDIPRERVFIFSKVNDKVKVRRPNIETYGTSFDLILEECFSVDPPISKLSRDEFEHLKNSNNTDELREAIERLGDSVQRTILIDYLLHKENELEDN